jgi:hypothetical protein
VLSLLARLSCCLHDSFPISLELVNISTYRDPSQVEPFHVLMMVTLETNATSLPDDCTDIFEYGAQVVFGFPDNVDFALAYDDPIPFRRVVGYFPGAQEGYFRIHSQMLPVQVATKMIHMAARILKKARRDLKAAKNPQLGGIKDELRSIHKLMRNTTDPAQLRGLNGSRNALIDQLVAMLPAAKQRIRRLKIQNKDIADRTERKAANQVVRVMKAMVTDKMSAPGGRRRLSKRELIN